MNNLEIISLITIIIYILASLFGLTGMMANRLALRKIGCHLAIAAFLFQTIALITGFHKSATGFLSSGAWLQLVAWFILLCSSASWWRLRTDALLLFASPFALFLFILSLPWLNSPLALPRQMSSTFYLLHTGAIFLALGLCSLGFIASVLFLFLQKRIKKRKNIHGYWQNIPHLELLDKINAVCVYAIFPLYSLGILTGLLWAAPVYGKTISGDPKEYASLLIWILLAILFHNRLAASWKGKKPAVVMILIFAISLFSLLGLNFLLPGHHSFISSN